MPRPRSARYTRPPLERMLAIHQLLVDQRFPNAQQLARQFEVNPRTIKRDIEFMRDRFHLPIEYNPARRGHYYSQPVKHFPTVTLSQRELFALLVAQKVVAAYQGTVFAAPLRSALKRLTSLLDDGNPISWRDLGDTLSFRPLGPEDTDIAKFELLTKALREKHILTFRYRRLAEKQWQRRRVAPLHLACIENHWYLIAYDFQRKALRTFALSRIEDARLTLQTFKPPEKFVLDEYLRDSFSVFKGHDDYEVVIEFDAWATDLLRGRSWQPRHEWLELPGGGSRLRLRLNNIEEILGWVLSWGPHAMVVRPQRLADRVREAAAEILKRYAGSSPEIPATLPLMPR